MKLTPLQVGTLVILVALVFFAMAINSQPHGWGAWYDLWRSGQTSQATVTSLHPQDHHGCSLKYTIDSKEYEAKDDGCYAQIGEVVSITYSPADPAFVTLKSPKQEFFSLVLAPVIVSVLAGLMAAWRAGARSNPGP